MTTPLTPLLTDARGGAGVLRAAIIASTCSDEGACIMCRDCGHIFAPSVAFTDESQAVDNVTLARALYYHMCAMGRKPDVYNPDRSR